MVEWLDDDSYILEEPESEPKEGTYHGHLRMVSGEHFVCDCEAVEIQRINDDYMVKGSAYHHRDSASEALICSKCNERFVINPNVVWVDSPEPKGSIV